MAEKQNKLINLTANGSEILGRTVAESVKNLMNVLEENSEFKEKNLSLNEKMYEQSQKNYFEELKDNKNRKRKNNDANKAMYRNFIELKKQDLLKTEDSDKRKAVYDEIEKYANKIMEIDKEEDLDEKKGVLEIKSSLKENENKIEKARIELFEHNKARIRACNYVKGFGIIGLIVNKALDIYTKKVLI